MNVTKNPYKSEIQHPEKYWFLPYKAVRKYSHFNKSVQTTRNLFMGPSSHLDDKNLSRNVE